MVPMYEETKRLAVMVPFTKTSRAWKRMVKYGNVCFRQCGEKKKMEGMGEEIDEEKVERSEICGRRRRLNNTPILRERL